MLTRTLETPAARTPMPRRHKVMALLAAGTVVGVGLTATLAAWNDAEWITGSLGTTTFEVQQNVTAWDAAAWTDQETAGDPGLLTFSTGALNLSPAEASYTPVSLTTTANSVAANSLTLASATSAAPTDAADVGGALFSALTLRVVVITTAPGATPAPCDAAAFAAGSAYVVGSDILSPALATAGTVASTLEAAGADKLDYCFEIALPAGADDALQGRQVAPIWNFVAESVED